MGAGVGIDGAVGRGYKDDWDVLYKIHRNSIKTYQKGKSAREALYNRDYKWNQLFNRSVKEGKVGQRDGSKDTDVSCQAWKPECNSQDPYSGRWELIPASCPQKATHALWHLNASYNTHIHTNKWREQFFNIGKIELISKENMLKC